MVKFDQVLACVAALLMIATTVDASFAFCVGVNDVNFFHTVVGFYLWNDAGDNGHHYDTTAGKHISLSNNGWVVETKSATSFPLKDLTIKNSKYNFNSNVPFVALCAMNFPPGRGAVYYGCYDTGNSYCKNNEDAFVDACGTWIEMGTESLLCKTD
ncbi:hypothetical protein BGX21_003553 [Mortierella sp. AD011]|nr:hypothetical protein BGX21_003553 [Mortierella sp. AD011]